MSTELRNATSDHIDGMMPLFCALYKGDIGRHFADLLQEYLNSDSHIVTVAMADARIVAVLVGSYRLDMDYECRAGLIDAVVVREDYRRRGIGKQLVAHFAEWAASKDCTVLQVVNGRRHFFEAIGFKERPATLHQLHIKT